MGEGFQERVTPYIQTLLYNNSKESKKIREMKVGKEKKRFY